MNLKERITQISLLLLTVVLGWSCTKDNYDASTGGNTELPESNIGVFINTRATDPNASNIEKSIKSVYVYIYNSIGTLENKGEVFVDPAGSAIVDSNGRLNKEWTVKEGAKDIYVVANPDVELAAKLAQNLPKAQLVDLVTTVGGWNVDSFDTKGMLMTGYEQVVVKASTSQTTSPMVYVALERRHARIDFNLKKAAELAGVKVEVNSLQLTEQEQVGKVFPFGTTNYTDYSEKASVGASFTAPISIDSDFKIAPFAHFYTYPRPNQTGMKALRLVMNVSIGDMKRDLDVFISEKATHGGSDNAEDSPLEIKANNIYNIEATLTMQYVDINIEIGEWTDEPVDSPIHGAELKLSSTYVRMDCAIINNKTTTVTYTSNAKTTVTSDNKGASWLMVSNSATDNGTKGTITLKQIATTNAIPDENKQAKVFVKSGNITRTITVVWVPVSGL